ncbi:hypothetical protein IW261DRAFT_1482381 [Armillaria novae-zelandiae]|uniref:F-box domain-containing protein n=1 Tax=Armillaria novae-zelandiae TaxID=153914 RepID=A0AA39TBK6_9AGAR|nr:hypothetical protein IW261DRAFT_1482381 [Armillaria novae-zelandiae]
MTQDNNEGKSQDEVVNAPDSNPSCGELAAISRCRINELLPNELLADIFATAMIDFLPEDHRSFLALVCSICRRWRGVAIEASDLWTTIYLHDPKDIPAAELFLERSKTQLLDVYVQVGLGFEDFSYDGLDVSGQSVRRVAELMSTHLHRTRTLSLSVSNFEGAENFPTLYRPMSAPHLVSLSINIRDIPPFLDSICSFSSDGRDGLYSNRTSISSLTRLELIISARLEYEELQSVFTSFPSLETLILPRFNGLGKQHGKDRPIMLAPSSLRSLAVHLKYIHSHSYAGNSSHCSCVLGSVHFQNLEYLEVLGEKSSQNLNLSSHFKDLSKLKTLRLQRCYVPSLDDDFFRSLNLLNHLELVDNLSHVEWFTESLPTKATLLFPHLSSISLSDDSGESHDMSQWARLARLAVQNAGCTQFSVKVTAQHLLSMTRALSPQDEGIRVEIEDYHPLLRLLPPGLSVDWSDDDDDYWNIDHASDFDGYTSSD